MAEPMEIERKYLVRPPVPLKKLGKYRVIDIEQFYLVSLKLKEKIRFRKCVQSGNVTYFCTAKRATHHPAVRYENEFPISAGEYEEGKQSMVPGSHLVHKQRMLFIYAGQQFELDRFINPALKNRILEIELDNEHDTVRLPPFLNIIREMTGDKNYSNYKLAFR